MQIMYVPDDIAYGLVMLFAGQVISMHIRMSSIKAKLTEVERKLDSIGRFQLKHQPKEKET